MDWMSVMVLSLFVRSLSGRVFFFCKDRGVILYFQQAAPLREKIFGEEKCGEVEEVNIG